MPRRHSLASDPDPNSDISSIDQEHAAETGHDHEDAFSDEEHEHEVEAEAEDEDEDEEAELTRQQNAREAVAAEQQQLRQAIQTSLLPQYTQTSPSYTGMTLEHVTGNYMLSYYDETGRLHVEAINPDSDSLPPGENQVVLSGTHQGISVLVLRAANKELYIRFPKPPTEPPPKRPALTYQYGSSRSGSEASPVVASSGIQRVPTPYPKLTSSS